MNSRKGGINELLEAGHHHLSRGALPALLARSFGLICIDGNTMGPPAGWLPIPA
jgi:hypothetical protein